MNTENPSQSDRVLEALKFYSNCNSYWSKPIPSDVTLDMRTLKMCSESYRGSEVMKDRGELAKLALKEYEESHE